jgi:hypothetical protein
MKSNNVELFSPLTPEKCAACLKAAIARERTTLDMWSDPIEMWLGSKPVSGEVTKSSVWLRKRRIVIGGFSQRFFNANMRPEGSGTLLSGAFIMHPLFRTELAFGCILGIVGLGFLASRLTPTEVWEGFWHERIGPFMILIIAILFIFDLYRARSDRRFITKFLISTLNANIHTRET